MKLMTFLTCLLLYASVASAQTDGVPQFGNIEVQELPQVQITACARGKKACYEGRADLGCVRQNLSAKDFKNACGLMDVEREKWNIGCFVKINGVTKSLGKTKTEEACVALQKSWADVWKDPILSKKFISPESRISFFNNTLLERNKKRDNPGLFSQLTVNNNGRIQKTSSDNDALNKRINQNLEEYQNDTSCGVGILPGIDRVPVLNQGFQGTCYAHAASTLIDYARRFKMGGGMTTYGSPLMAAIDYQMASGEDVKGCSDPFGGGITCGAFNSSMQKGFCNTEDLEKAIIVSFDKPHQSKSQSWYLDWSKKQKLSVSTDKSNVRPNDHVLAYLHLIGTLYEEKDWKRLKELWSILDLNGTGSCDDPTSSKKSDLDWEKVKWSTDLENFYASYFKGICKRESVPFKASCRESNGPFKSAQLDKALEAGYPIGVNYCSKVLQDRNYKSKTSHLFKDESCGPHASVLVGTSIDSKKRCTYVIRNSWGKSCGSYDKTFDCIDGNIYIPKDIFLKNLHSISEIHVD